MTLACARMGWNVHDTEVISLVTAQPHTAVRRGGQAIVLSKNRSTPKALAALLNAHGRGDSEFSVLEQLGGPAERRRDGTARQWANDPPHSRRPQRDRRPLPARRTHVAVARRRVRPRRPDHQTRNPRGDPGGAGAAAGGAAVGRRRGLGQHRGRMVPELARLQRGGVRTRRAAPPQHRIQRRGLRCQTSTSAARRRTAFDGAEAPSAIFIGGGLTQPGLLDACLDNLPAGGRLVANAVTVESEAADSAGIFAPRRPAATLPALSGRAAGRLHRLAPAAAGHPVGGDKVTVYFIGAGPGAADLITVRGQRLLETMRDVPVRGFDHARRPAGAVPARRENH